MTGQQKKDNKKAMEKSVESRLRLDYNKFAFYISRRYTGLACYLTRWLTADALKNSAVAGNMFETFVVSEILKSYTNEGKDYRFNIFYYRGKDKSNISDNEIDLIIEENGILYPIEIKMTGNPKAQMGATNPVLDKVPDKKRGMGVILCLVDRKIYLRENLVALPIEFI